MMTVPCLQVVLPVKIVGGGADHSGKVQVSDTTAVLIMFIHYNIHSIHTLHSMHYV